MEMEWQSAASPFELLLVSVDIAIGAQTGDLRRPAPTRSLSGKPGVRPGNRTMGARRSSSPANFLKTMSQGAAHRPATSRAQVANLLLQATAQIMAAAIGAGIMATGEHAVEPWWMTKARFQENPPICC